MAKRKKDISGEQILESSLLEVRERIVISKPDPYTKDMKRIDVYVTNNLSLKDKEIVYHFSRRWRTEDFNRDAKDNLAFDQYQVRSLKAIKRHWCSVFIAHSFFDVQQTERILPEDTQSQSKHYRDLL